jgi:lipoate-protein ligase A
MAADYFLAQRAKINARPILRLYTWDTPTLSLGYHQKINKKVIRCCSDSEVPIVRRPTGGRAVLHDNELTYCLTLPTDHPIFVDKKKDFLRSIGSIFVHVADTLGLKADVVRIGSRAESKVESLRKGSPLCFDAASRWEVQLNGEKWIGSAQRLLPGVLLQHGSILLGESRIDIGRLFGLKSRTKAAQSVLYEGVDRQDLAQSIPIEFGREWGIEWHNQALTSEEINQILPMAEDHVYHVNGKVLPEVYSSIVESSQ